MASITESIANAQSAIMALNRTLHVAYPAMRRKEIGEMLKLMKQLEARVTKLETHRRSEEVQKAEFEAARIIARDRLKQSLTSLGEEDLERLVKVCAGKKRYTTAEEAGRNATWAKNRGARHSDSLRVYGCPCGGFHLTHLTLAEFSRRHGEGVEAEQ